MTRFSPVGTAAIDLDVSPESENSRLAWILIALVPVTIFASTVTSLAAMG